MALQASYGGNAGRARRHVRHASARRVRTPGAIIPAAGGIVRRSQSPGVAEARRSSVAEATTTEHETLQVEQANATDRTPVVFIHGPLAPPQQLGPLGRAVRGGGLRAAGPGLARPSPGAVDQAKKASLRCSPTRPSTAGRRPLRRGDRPARQEARRGGAFVRRPADADPRRARAGVAVRGDQPRPVPRRAAAPDLVAQGCLAQEGAGAGSRPSRAGRASPDHQAEDHLRPAGRDLRDVAGPRSARARGGRPPGRSGAGPPG